MPWPLQLHERDLVHMVQEAGWASGLIWMDVKRKSLTSTRVWSLNVHPAASCYTNYPILSPQSTVGIL